MGIFKNSKTKNKPKNTVIIDPAKAIKKTRDHLEKQPTEAEKFEAWASEAIVAQMDLSTKLLQTLLGMARLLKLDPKKYEEFSSDAEKNNAFLREIVGFSEARMKVRVQKREAAAAENNAKAKEFL